MRVKCIRTDCSTLKTKEEEINIVLHWYESLKDWWLIVPNTPYSASVTSLKKHAKLNHGWHANVLTKTAKGFDKETGESYYYPGYDGVHIPQEEINKVLSLCAQLILNYEQL
jgi:hypothetical protein